MYSIRERLGAGENDGQSHSAYSDGDHEPPNKKLKRFNVWNYFIKIKEDGKEMCECKACGKMFMWGGKSNISHLDQHIPKCTLILKSRIAKYFELKKLDHAMVRESITQMTIKHYLPFQFVEWDEFRAFTKLVYHNEDHLLSRDAVVGDVMKVYLLEKDKLKKQLAAIKGSVCLSICCWTSSASSRGYVTLTAHFMDDQWNLIVKLLNFGNFDPSHDNFDLSRKVIGYLQEWGIERNIFSITMDNASANGDNLLNMKNQLGSLDSLLRTFITSATPASLEKHFKCCARVLDLMVEESLKVAGDVLDKIRNSLKYVSVSNSRLKQFFQCVEEVGVGDGSDDLHLDVSGKWVSTYTMLKSAIEYRGVFERMCLKDTTYNHCPSSEEWERGEKICAFLKNFCVLTNMVSESTYPTLYTNLYEFLEIEFSLKSMMLSEDDKIRNMASKMLIEFDKYLSEYSMILAFASVLNPSMKFWYLEYLYKKLGHDMDTVKDKVSSVRKAIYALFNEYANKYASTRRLRVIDSGLTSYDRFREYLEKERQEKYAGGVSELDLYLKEKYRDVDALRYWNNNDHEYDILARMARDVFSIPIIAVASESAFSPGRCILNKYRSCMVSKNLEALVCSHNWLFGFAPSDQFGDEVEETRKIGINLSKKV